MKRITFITGHFGSGKTEIALNLAVNYHVDYLIDLDIINPYFRSREFKHKLNQSIEVIASDLAHDEYSDLPYLSKRIFLPFHKENTTAIYDLGGSDLGMKLIRQFHRENIKDIDVYLTININRPETKDSDSIIALIHQLEIQGGIKITGLINNTNLLKETTVDDIKLGEVVIKEVSLKTEIPVVFTCVEETLDMKDSQFIGEIIRLKRYFGKKWRN